MNSSATARFAGVAGALFCAGRINLPRRELPAHRDRSAPQCDGAIDLSRVFLWRVCLPFKIPNFMAVLLSLIFGTVQFSNRLSHLSNVLNRTKVSKELFHMCLPLFFACNKFNIRYRYNVQDELKSSKSISCTGNKWAAWTAHQFTATAGTLWLCPFASQV